MPPPSPTPTRPLDILRPLVPGESVSGRCREGETRLGMLLLVLKRREEEERGDKSDDGERKRRVDEGEEGLDDGQGKGRGDDAGSKVVVQHRTEDVDEAAHLARLLGAMLDRTLLLSSSRQETLAMDVDQVLHAVVEEADPALTSKIRRSLLDLCRRGFHNADEKYKQSQDNNTLKTYNKQRWAFARSFIKHARLLEVLELGPFLLACCSSTPLRHLDDDNVTDDEEATLFYSALWTHLQRSVAALSSKPVPVLSVARLTALGATGWWPLSTGTESALGDHRAHVVGQIRFPNQSTASSSLSPSKSSRTSATNSTKSPGGAWFTPSSFLAIPFSPLLNAVEFSVEVQVKVNPSALQLNNEFVFVSSRVGGTSSGGSSNGGGDPPKGWEIDVRKVSLHELVFTFRAGEDKVTARLVHQQHQNYHHQQNDSTSPFDDWIHVMCCRSNQRLSLVLNYGEVARFVVSGVARPYKPNTDAPLYVGSWPGSPPSTSANSFQRGKFEGGLANLVVYNTCVLKDTLLTQGDDGAAQANQSSQTTSTTRTNTSPRLSWAVSPTFSPRGTVRLGDGPHPSSTSTAWGGQITTPDQALLFIFAMLAKVDDKLLVLNSKSLNVLLVMYAKLGDAGDDDTSSSPRVAGDVKIQLKMTMLELLQRARFVGSSRAVDGEAHGIVDEEGLLRALLALGAHESVGGKVLERIFASGLVRSSRVLTKILSTLLLRDPVVVQAAARAISAGQQCLIDIYVTQKTSIIEGDCKAWVNQVLHQLTIALDDMQKKREGHGESGAGPALANLERARVLIDLANECCVGSFVANASSDSRASSPPLIALSDEHARLFKQVGEFIGILNSIVEVNPSLPSDVVPVLCRYTEAFAWNLMFCFTQDLVRETDKKMAGRGDSVLPAAAAATTMMMNEIVDFLHESNPVVELAGSSSSSSSDPLQSLDDAFEAIKRQHPLSLVHRARFTGKPGEIHVWNALKHTFKAIVHFMGGTLEDAMETAWKSSWSILPAITSRRQQLNLIAVDAGGLAIAGDEQVREICNTVEDACMFLVGRTPTRNVQLSREDTTTTTTTKGIVITFVQACINDPLLLPSLKQQIVAKHAQLEHATLVLSWITSLFPTSAKTFPVSLTALQEYLFDVACTVPMKLRDICGPRVVAGYETARKGAVFAALQDFLAREQPSRRPPMALVLKTALQCGLIGDDDDDGAANEFIFDLCAPLLLASSHASSSSGQEKAGDGDSFSMAASDLRYFPKSSGYQWSRYHHQQLLSNGNTRYDNVLTHTVSADGLMLSSVWSNASSALGGHQSPAAAAGGGDEETPPQWQQVPLHVGTHGMMSGLFYVELAALVMPPHCDFVVLAIGLTSRPQTETFDCGCRVVLGREDGVGMLLDLNRGLLSFHWVSSTAVQAGTRATRRIALGEETFACEVPPSRPVYFATALLTESCLVKTVFAENAEEQLVLASATRTTTPGTVAGAVPAGGAAAGLGGQQQQTSSSSGNANIVGEGSSSSQPNGE